MVAQIFSLSHTHWSQSRNPWVQVWSTDSCWYTSCVVLGVYNPVVECLPSKYKVWVQVPPCINKAKGKRSIGGSVPHIGSLWCVTYPKWANRQRLVDTHAFTTVTNETSLLPIPALVIATRPTVTTFECELCSRHHSISSSRSVLTLLWRSHLVTAFLLMLTCLCHGHSASFHIGDREPGARVEASRCWCLSDSP